MSKSILSGLSLRSGAIVFSLFTALGASATADTLQHKSTTAPSIKPSQAAWGYPIGAALSEPEAHRAPTVAQTGIKPSQAAWGYPIGAAPSEPEAHRSVTVAQPGPSIRPSQAAWGYPIGAASSESTAPKTRSAVKVSQPAPHVTAQTSR